MVRTPLLAGAVALAACSFTPGGDPTGPDADTSDGVLAIDSAVDPDGAPLPDGAQCTAGCQGDVLTTCAGNTPTTETCVAGCGTSGAPHCLLFQPSNGVTTTAALAATVDLSVATNRLYVFNTDDGSITSYDHANANGMPVRAAGNGAVDQIEFTPRTQSGTTVELGVWSLKSFTLPDANAWVGFRGARAAVVVTAGPIVVHGVIDVSGEQTVAGVTCHECPGAGGGRGATRTVAGTGCAPGGPGTFTSGIAWETGGAGGGMATQGGGGGGASQPGGAPAAITSCPGPELVPLLGGGGGGRGATNGTDGGASGGGGGGGLQLTSLTSIVVDGNGAEVFSGGVGGDGEANAWGGGGGGAGGALLLEAPTVTLGTAATVTANGGGGGAGHNANNGEFGRSDTQRAAGGAGDGAVGANGRGGFGGVTTSAIDVTATPSAGLGGADGTGGGGGAAGRVRLNTRDGRTPTTAGAVVSPAPSVGTRPAQ